MIYLKLQISIEPEKPLTVPIVFIMPRSVPGNYGVTKYDLFVKNILAESPDPDALTFLGPRLLNYSVFGWIEGYDRQTVQCTIRTFPSWPIFSTIVPTASPAKGNLEFGTSDYYTLADAQTFLGPRFRVKEYKALVPLFIADFSETREADLDNYAWMETHSMEILKNYFGELPFPSYTALFRQTIPLPDDDPGNFAMEHLQSSTFFGDTSQSLPRRRPTSEHEICSNQIL